MFIEQRGKLLSHLFSGFMAAIDATCDDLGWSVFTSFLYRFLIQAFSFGCNGFKEHSQRGY